MKELTLSQQYALISLDGQDSHRFSVSKSIALRGIAAASVLEEALKEDYESERFAAAVQQAVTYAKGIRKKEAEKMEEEICAQLESDGLIEEIPDILGCDMDYYTAGIERKAYRSEKAAYFKICEGLRSEILEEGAISMENAVLLWLLRESGCIHEVFSVTEQKRVQERMVEQSSEQEVYRKIWDAEFRSVAEQGIEKFLKIKKRIFQNPYLEGVNLIFPYIERRNSIFIDFVVLGTNVQERRIAVMEHISKMGHYVEEVMSDGETLLKIDNTYYRIFPTVKRAYKVPIQGAAIIPVYK